MLSPQRFQLNFYNTSAQLHSCGAREWYIKKPNRYFYNSEKKFGEGIYSYVRRTILIIYFLEERKIL